MTDKEFTDYINSFLTEGKKQFTRDEIYQIGVAHKSLPKQDKSWKALATIVKWEGTPESLRSYINFRTKKENKISQISSNTDNTNNEELDKLTLGTQEFIKERQRVRDEWSTYRRFLREDARIDSLKDSIRDSIKEIDKLPHVKSNKENIQTDTEAILMISDLHIGVDCDNYYNKYNSDIAEKRVMKLVDNAIKYCKLHKVKRLNVVNLGDLINGIIHVTSRIEQEFDVVQQIIRASEILSRALNKLQEAAPEIIYRSVTDNHSRAMANKNEAIEKEQFSQLIDWYLKERLKDTSIEFVNDNLDVDIGKFTLLNGKKVMFAHGHNDNANQAFQHFIGATKEFIDYVLLAHFHSEKLKCYQGMKVYVNGSIVGTEQYASSKRLYSNPSQTLLVFDNDNVINYSVDLTNI